MHSGFSADPSQPPTVPLPAISELKNFLSAEPTSFKDELKPAILIPLWIRFTLVNFWKLRTP